MRTAVESSLKAFTIKVKLICVDCTCVLIIFSQIWSHFFRCHFWKVFQFPFFPDFPDILKISSDLIVHLIIFSHMISYHIIFWKIIQFLNIFSKILEKVPGPVSGTVWKLTFSSFRNNMLQNLFHLAFWENQSWLSCRCLLLNRFQLQNPIQKWKFSVRGQVLCKIEKSIIPLFASSMTLEHWKTLTK